MDRRERTMRIRETAAGALDKNVTRSSLVNLAHAHRTLPRLTTIPGPVTYLAHG